MEALGRIAAQEDEIIRLKARTSHLEARLKVEVRNAREASAATEEGDGEKVGRARIPLPEESNWTVGSRGASGAAGMHRSVAEGRFGEAEPEGRASVCAEPSLRAIGVEFKDWHGDKSENTTG